MRPKCASIQYHCLMYHNMAIFLQNYMTQNNSGIFLLWNQAYYLHCLLRKQLVSQEALKLYTISLTRFYQFTFIRIYTNIEASLLFIHILYTEEECLVGLLFGELLVIDKIKVGKFGHKDTIYQLKIWLVKVWRIMDDSPNLPNFPAAKHSHNTAYIVSILRFPV